MDTRISSDSADDGAAAAGRVCRCGVQRPINAPQPNTTATAYCRDVRERSGCIEESQVPAPRLLAGLDAVWLHVTNPLPTPDSEITTVLYKPNGIAGTPILDFDVALGMPNLYRLALAGENVNKLGTFNRHSAHTSRRAFRRIFMLPTGL